MTCTLHNMQVTKKKKTYSKNKKIGVGVKSI